MNFKLYIQTIEWDNLRRNYKKEDRENIQMTDLAVKNSRFNFKIVYFVCLDIKVESLSMNQFFYSMCLIAAKKGKCTAPFRDC